METISRIYQIQFEDLRKMVNHMALTPRKSSEPVRTEGPRKKKENREEGGQTAQKLMLTWLASYPKMFDTIAGYIGPEDFITPLYHQVAQLVFAQHEEGAVNPAKLLNQFSDPEELREVTSLFHASLHLENQEDAKKAVLETVCRLKRDSIAWQNQHLAPTDLAGLQKIVEARKRLEDLERGRVTLYISFD